MSATVDVCMPQLGESVERGTIVRWLKGLGDAVAPDEPLYEVSSDKATMEVPAMAAGVVHEILAAEGDSAVVGTVIARIASPGAAARASADVSTAADGHGSSPERLSPVVRRLLREHGLDPAAVTGSAEGGRITRDDVLAHVAARAKVAAAPSAPATSEGVRRVVLSPLRARAIEHLASAQKSAVNVFSVIEIDCEAIAAERARRKLRFLPFIARAIVDALLANDALNATFDADGPALLVHEAVHLGIAVDVGGDLVVPVVRDAQRLTLGALAGEIDALAAGARARTLALDAYRGSTFTLTNNGSFGTLMTAPVINAPNVAIASSDTVELRPVIVDRAIAIRHRMYLGLTWDHRACDGAAAGAFLSRIKRNVESWDWSAQ